MPSKSIGIRIDAELYTRISELAFEQRRTTANFIRQFLRVSLSEDLDKAALFRKMNPALSAGLIAAGRLREVSNAPE